MPPGPGPGAGSGLRRPRYRSRSLSPSRFPARRVAGYKAGDGVLGGVADTTDEVLETLAVLQAAVGATHVLLLTDRADVAEDAVKRLSVPVLLATADRDLAADLGERVRLVPLTGDTSSGLALLPALKDVFLGAYLSGTVGPKDRVLALATNRGALDVLAVFDAARDLELGHLRDEVGARAPMAVVDRVLRLASELAHEGREGKPVGTLFVLADSENVMARSRQAVLNPFHGHPPEARSVLRDEAWETIKEFAQLDGAFVVREDGVVLAAGRYMDLEEAPLLQAGLGGRHLAAASITKRTKAIAIAVSSNGAIRVFKDGKALMVVGKT